ncbi:MAG: phenylalanine--tRNA ligase subunit beta, partial [Agathobacter sp.]|nr:phenylalanine--tRNA ligase subunit beta [Agathobacter sp.]
DVNTGNAVTPKSLTVSIDKVNKVLGITVPTEDILRIMTNLDFAPVVDGDVLTLQIPAYREDMETYQDVAEEVIRMYGYEHIVPTFMPTAKVTTGGLNLEQKTELRLKKALCAVGAHECIHYSFFSPSDLDLLKLPEDAPERHAIRIMNPISEELSLMRTTLAASMINAVSRNQKKGNLEGRLFEIAKRFIPKELPLTEYPDERQTLCVTVFGEKESFFTLKGIAQTVANTLHVNFEYANTTKTFLHPYQTASISCEGVEIGYLGKVAYDVAEECVLRTPMYLMELDLAALSQWYGKKAMFKPLPKFPEEQRDLAIVVDKAVTCGEIEKTMKEACKYITSIKLFDIYEGAQIGEDKKSMAFTVLFTPKDEAFTNESVDNFVKKILKQLGKACGAELRS